MIKLLLVDDHPLILEGSKQIFSDAPNIVVETLADVQTFSEVIIHTQYDVFLLDINYSTICLWYVGLAPQFAYYPIQLYDVQ
ncbi:response regulator [Metasolibacillus sp.]|uniref:response regulator transcription factor n=1 Tax=Metasolibacillus sp. TaxID=2703680 RepID=UPI0025F88231|nr:response regulator [Metasolibacillus sp.]MCT6926074.1 hypothetical protein [Metasolibacillus sp.]MCT6942206.1 hypothetical protein [Metasolibacillus sp.]